MKTNNLTETTRDTINFLNKLTWNYLDNNILTEDIDILKLRYETKHRFLSAANTWFFASIPLAYNFYGKSNFLFGYFVFTTIISIVQMIILNREANKLLFAIEYKIKNKKKLIERIFNP